MNIPYVYKSCHFLLCADDIVLPTLDCPYAIHAMRDNAPGFTKAFGMTEAQVVNRFSQRQICFVATENNKYLGIVWGGTGDCYIRGIGKRLSLGQNGVYLYGFQTLPEARRRYVNTNLWKAAIEYYKLLGYSKIYIYVAIDNYIVLRKMILSGFKKLYILSSIKVFHFVFLYEKNIFAKHGKLEIIYKEPKECYII